VAVAAELVTPAFSGPTQAAQQPGTASVSQSQVTTATSSHVTHN
jgi:hypothetical protein